MRRLPGAFPNLGAHDKVGRAFRARRWNLRKLWRFVRLRMLAARTECSPYQSKSLGQQPVSPR